MRATGSIVDEIEPINRAESVASFVRRSRSFDSAGFLAGEEVAVLDDVEVGTLHAVDLVEVVDSDLAGVDAGSLH